MHRALKDSLFPNLQGRNDVWQVAMTLILPKLGISAETSPWASSIFLLEKSWSITQSLEQSYSWLGGTAKTHHLWRLALTIGHHRDFLAKHNDQSCEQLNSVITFPLSIYLLPPHGCTCAHYSGFCSQPWKVSLFQLPRYESLDFFWLFCCPLVLHLSSSWSPWWSLRNLRRRSLT